MPNSALRHKDIWRRKGVSPHILYYVVQGGEQRSYAKVAWSSEKYPLVASAWVPDLIWTFQTDSSLLHMLAVRQPLSGAACRTVTIATEMPPAPAWQ